MLEAAPDVFNHNIETAERFYRRVRPKGDYQRALDLLDTAKDVWADLHPGRPPLLTKSGLIVGMGETDEDVLGVMRDLRDHRRRRRHDRPVPPADRAAPAAGSLGDAGAVRRVPPRRRGDGLRVRLRRPAGPVELPGRRAAPGRAGRVPRSRALNRACGRTIGAGADGFHILTWGSEEQPPLVCLHAERGHARRFERLARMLRDRMRVIAYDMRGHGRSPWSGDQSLAAHADDVGEVMEACGGRTGGDARRLVRGPGGDRARGRARRPRDGARPARPAALPDVSAARRRLEAQGRTGAFVSVDDAVERLRAEPGSSTRRGRFWRRRWPSTSSPTRTGGSGSATAAGGGRAADALIFSPPRLKEIVCPTLIVRATSRQAQRRGRRAGRRGAAGAAS